MKRTSNIYLKLGVSLVTELPALQYVCVHVNGHSCLLAIFRNRVTSDFIDHKLHINCKQTKTSFFTF